MPDLITHYHFYEVNRKDYKKEFEDVLKIATQGPDPLFICDLGGYCHNTRADINYEILMQIADESEDKELYYTFIDGLFMHFALDSVAHPLIVSRAGYGYPEVGLDRLKFGHNNFETLLDYINARRYNLLLPNFWDIMLGVSDEHLEKLDKLWVEFNNRVTKFDNIGEHPFTVGVKHYIYGVKYSNLEPTKAYAKKILHRYGMYSKEYFINMYRPIPKANAKLDILNNSHVEWEYPAYEGKSTESFDDLFEKASKLYQQLHSLLLRRKEGQDIKEELFKLMGQNDHCGTPFGKHIYKSTPIWKEGYNTFGEKIDDFEINPLYRREKIPF